MPLSSAVQPEKVVGNYSIGSRRSRTAFHISGWNGILTDASNGRRVWQCSHRHSHIGHDTKTLASAHTCAALWRAVLLKDTAPLPPIFSTFKNIDDIIAAHREMCYRAATGEWIFGAGAE